MKDIMMESSRNSTPARVRAVRTTITRYGPLNCIKIEKDPRGRTVSVDHFDVPSQEYGEGNMTGYRLAGEFMAALEAGRGEISMPHREVITAAYLVLDQSSPCEGTGRRGAAVSFTHTLEELICAVARGWDYRAFIQWRIDRFDECQRAMAQQEKARRSDFVRRMEMAKATKALTRRLLAEVAHGGPCRDESQGRAGA